MSTFDKRRETVHRIIADDLIEPLEALKFTILWIRFEYTILARDRKQRKADRIGKKLQERIDLFNFRHQLQDL